VDTEQIKSAGPDYVRGGKQKALYSLAETVEWPCPLCGSSEAELIKTERGVLKVVECKSCDLIRVNPRLESPESVYQGDQALYEAEFREIILGKRPHHRDKNYLQDIAVLERLKPTGNFLDIGTSTGAFLRHARGRGWNLTGVEPSPSLGGLARKWWGLEIKQGFVEKLDLPSAHYDIVTMTDVFEHIVNPREVLATVRRVLKPDGIVFIKVPNGLFNVMKYRMRHMLGKAESDDFDAYEHVVHYSEQTLDAMIRAAGLKPLEIVVETPVQPPMWHKYVGQYFQHQSPFFMDWKTYSAREVLYQAARLEKALTRHVGYLAPNIGCIATCAS